MARVKLMTPGPVEVPRRVLEAASKPVISHRCGEFRELLRRVTEGLMEVFGLSDGYVAVLAGSGTSAVDAMLWGFIGPGEKVLIVAHGLFGERIAESLRARGAAAEVLTPREPGGVVDPEDVGRVLEGGGFKAVVLVHNETSMGVRYPWIRRVSEEAHESGALVLVDAVSSLAGDVFSMEEMGVDAAASCSHKAIAAPPGAGFVAVTSEAARLLRSDVPPSLSVKRYVEKYRATGETPFTPPVNTLYAVSAALERILVEYGLDKYIEMHRERAWRLYRGMPRGYRRVALSDETASVTVPAFWTPVPAGRVIAKALERGLRIAPGVGRYRERMVRIGVMGDISMDDIEELVEAAAEALEPG